jgi:hypothetical protein
MNTKTSAFLFLKEISNEKSRMSLAGESSSASASDRGSLAAGVRGLSGAITMERSEHEKLKYPDRINLDRKGLHGKQGLLHYNDFNTF